MTSPEEHLDFGLPLPRGSRLRVPRRVLAKILWPMLRHQAAYNRILLNEVHDLRSSIADLAVQPPTRDVEMRFEALEQAVDRVNASLGDVGEPLQRFEQAFVDHNVIIAEIQRDLSDERDRFAETLIRFADIDAKFERTGADIDRAGRIARDRFEEEAARIRRDFAELIARVDDAGRAVGADLDATRRELAEHRSRLAQLDLLLDSYRSTAPTGATAARPAPVPSALDGLRVAIDNAFGGSPNLARAMLKGHLGEFAPGPLDGKVVDLNCGRGDWLSVLRDAGIPAYGVDASTAHREQWQEDGLEAVVGDPLAHLRSLDAGSVPAVTAFGLAEQLAPDQLVELIDLAARALRSDGLLLLQTANPENLLVATSDLYLDPRARRPVPKRLLTFLVRVRGFTDLKVVDGRALDVTSLPVPASDDAAWVRDLLPILSFLNERFFGARDYAVIARRV